MDDEEIVVTWRAAIMPVNADQTIYGRLSKVGKGRVVVKIERNLPLGHACNFAVMLPKSNPDEANKFIEGRGVVALSVLSSMHFYVTVDKLKLEGNGEALLNERIEKHREAWRRKLG